MRTGTPEPSPAATHLRVLEGALLRIARSPEGSAFVLRGGLLLRHWFWPVARSVDDIDLVATFPFDPDGAARRLLPALESDAGDGVAFDPERTRVEAIWLASNSPGTRLFLTGTAGGVEVDFSVDVTFGPYPCPAPVFGTLPTVSGAVVRMLMCRPEAVVGQKVQALWHRGQRAWRPKDLNDLRLLLALVPMDMAALGEAICAYVTDAGGAPGTPRTLFGPESWWDLKAASARWSDFATATSEQPVPRDLAGVVSEIADRLAPILEKLP